MGQCEFQSDISRKTEHFPVSLSVVGLKGIFLSHPRMVGNEEGTNYILTPPATIRTRRGLLELVHDFLTAKGLPTSVMTGRTAFRLKLIKG